MASSADDILYIAICKFFPSGHCAVLSSLGDLGENGIHSIKQVIDDRKDSFQDIGSHYSLSSGKFVWHFLFDESEIVYLAIARENYPQRCAVMLLSEMQAFLKSMVSVSTVERDGALDRSCKAILTKVNNP